MRRRKSTNECPSVVADNTEENGEEEWDFANLSVIPEIPSATPNAIFQQQQQKLQLRPLLSEHGPVASFERLMPP